MTDVREKRWFQQWRHTVFQNIEQAFKWGADDVTLIGIKGGEDRLERGEQLDRDGVGAAGSGGAAALEARLVAEREGREHRRAEHDKNRKPPAFWERGPSGAVALPW